MEFFAGWRREEGPWVPASPYGYLVAETVLTSISLVPAVGMLFWALRSGQKHDNAMHEPFGYLKIALLLFTIGAFFRSIGLVFRTAPQQHDLYESRLFGLYMGSQTISEVSNYIIAICQITLLLVLTFLDHGLTTGYTTGSGNGAKGPSRGLLTTIVYVVSAVMASVWTVSWVLLAWVLAEIATDFGKEFQNTLGVAMACSSLRMAFYGLAILIALTLLVRFAILANQGRMNAVAHAYDIKAVYFILGSVVVYLVYAAFGMYWSTATWIIGDEIWDPEQYILRAFFGHWFLLGSLALLLLAFGSSKNNGTSLHSDDDLEPAVGA